MKNKITTTMIMLSMILSSIPWGQINVANAALLTVGPVNPINGFPNWYQDQNGLAIDQCFEPDNPKCLADPVIVGNNFSEQIGFGAEAFYWTTEALMDSKKADGIAGKALMVLALENAWFNENPVPGDQMVFARLRFFIDVPAAGRYQVTHPFGVAFFDVSQERITATAGIRAINANLLAESGFDEAASTDIPLGDFGCGAGPCNFSLALQGGVGPFLTWDTFNTDPAASDPLLVDAQGKRYVGDPLVEHRIKGSPFGTNIFRIEGPLGVDLDPNLAGEQNVIETDLFAVSGRVAVIDTVAPTVVSISPVAALLGSENVVLSANITDNLGVRTVTADLGSLGNNLSAALSGVQEVPSTASPATGNGSFTINAAANTLSFNITLNGLTGGAETSAHIHGPALAGANAPAVFNLPLGSAKNGIWNYPENLEADILSGKMYVQVHTVLFPGGEIRGQILPISNVQNLILTAGTRTDGTWGLIIPNLTRAGLFTIPITATDGSNNVVANHSLAVQVLTSINVIPAAATAVVGTTQQFVAQGLDQFGNPMDPQPAITWTSSNNVVATVNAAGLASGVTVGGPITIRAASGAISGTASLTVINPPSVLTSISLTPAASTIQVAGTRQLTAQALDQFGVAINPQPAITWTSSNNGVATVSANGLVTGVSLGSAVITATSGTTAATANITVSSAPACQTGADTNNDGFISNIEILNYVRGWKAGTVSNLLILRAINFWKSGVGC